MRNSIITGALSPAAALASSSDAWDMFSGALKPQEPMPRFKHNHTGAAKLKREARKRRNIRARNKK